jgi:hypothetical protein
VRSDGAAEPQGALGLAAADVTVIDAPLLRSAAAGYDTLGGFGTTPLEKITVFHSSYRGVVPISLNEAPPAAAPCSRVYPGVTAAAQPRPRRSRGLSLSEGLSVLI